MLILKIDQFVCPVLFLQVCLVLEGAECVCGVSAEWSDNDNSA